MWLDSKVETHAMADDDDSGDGNHGGDGDGFDVTAFKS